MNDDICIFLSAWKSNNKRGAGENPGQGKDRSSWGNCNSWQSPFFGIDQLIHLAVFSLVFSVSLQQASRTSLIHYSSKHTISTTDGGDRRRYGTSCRHRRKWCEILPLHFLVLAQDFSPFSFSLQVGYAFFSVFWRQDEGEDSEDEGAAAGEEDEKITRNWSIMKSNPPELRKSKVIQNFLYFTVVHILIFKAR